MLSAGIDFLIDVSTPTSSIATFDLNELIYNRRLAELWSTAVDITDNIKYRAAREVGRKGIRCGVGGSRAEGVV